LRFEGMATKIEVDAETKTGSVLMNLMKSTLPIDLRWFSYPSAGRSPALPASVSPNGTK